MTTVGLFLFDAFCLIFIGTVVDGRRIYDLGASIIPLRVRTKNARIKWKPYQSIRAPFDAVSGWLHECPQYGIVCGQLSNWYVHDFESVPLAELILAKSLNELKDFTLVVPTGRGVHIHWRDKEKRSLRTMHFGNTKYRELSFPMDFVGERTIAVGPGSIHKNGRGYEALSVIEPRFVDVARMNGEFVIPRIRAYLLAKLIIDCYRHDPEHGSNRHDFILHAGSYLRQHWGWSRNEAGFLFEMLTHLELLENIPPHDPEDTARTLDDVFRQELSSLKVGHIAYEVFSPLKKFEGFFVTHRAEPIPSTRIQHDYRLLSNFPDKLRPGQVELLSQLCGKHPKRAVLRAETGIGKTWVCLYFAKTIGPAVIVEPDKAMQEQLEKSYDVPFLKGQSNYICKRFNRPVHVSPCSLVDEERKGCIPGCEWGLALSRAEETLRSGGTIALNSGNWWRFEKARKLLVLDECHKVIEQLAQRILLHNASAATQEALRLDIDEASATIHTLVAELTALDLKSSDYNRVATEILNWQNRRQRLEFFLLAEVHRQHSVFLFKDRKGERFAKLDEAATASLFRDMNIEYLLFVSATPPAIDDVELVETKQSVATHVNGPIYYYPVAKLTSHELQKSMEPLRVAGQFIHDVYVSMRQDGSTLKAVVHTGNTKEHMGVGKYFSPFKILYHEKGELAETVERFRKDGDILLIASADAGFDFAGHDFGLQFVLKIPYPALDEEWKGKKQSFGEEKFQSDYNTATANKIIQMCGRNVRGEDDTGVTYILDSKFEEFYNGHRELFSQSFHSRLIDLSGNLKIPKGGGST